MESLAKVVPKNPSRRHSSLSRQVILASRAAVRHSTHSASATASGQKRALSSKSARGVRDDGDAVGAESDGSDVVGPSTTRRRTADEDYCDSGVVSASDGDSSDDHRRPRTRARARQSTAESEHSAEDSGEDGSDDDQHRPPTQEEVYKHAAVFLKTLHRLGQSASARSAPSGIIRPRFHRVRLLDLSSSLDGLQRWTLSSRRVGCALLTPCDSASP